ncbi:MAG: glycosyltransferase family 2 protein [Deinococcota bacterium]
MTEPLPVIIIHYNTPDILARCLQHLAHSTGQDDAIKLQIVVVDTSPKAVREQVQTVLNDADSVFTDITLLTPPNHSMANAVNVGLKHVLNTNTSPIIVHMNADVFVSLSVLKYLKTILLDDTHTAMVGPVCTTAEGNLQPQGFLYRWHYLRARLGKCVRVPWLSGCLQMVKREAVEAVGGMNSSYRFYNEDMEWCWRLWQAGWTCQLVDVRQFDDTSTVDESNTVDKSNTVDESNVIHLGGSSTPDDPAFVVEGFRGGYRLSQQYRNPLYQRLHRVIMYMYSSYLSRTHHNLKLRQAHTHLVQRFKRSNTLLSRFGPTLDEEA